MAPMGKLIDRGKRERARQQQGVRKQRILEEARSIFARMPFAEVTLDQIGQRADVDRGIASMYFGSKEKIFLQLLREELEVWYAGLADELAGIEGAAGSSDVAGLLAHRMAGCGLLGRLLSLAPVVLEQNMEAAEVYSFQRWRHGRMTEVGGLLERAGGLEAGSGFHLLYLAQLLTAGFEPAANPRGAAAFNRDDVDLAGLVIDLENELRTLLAAFLKAERSAL